MYVRALKSPCTLVFDEVVVLGSVDGGSNPPSSTISTLFQLSLERI